MALTLGTNSYTTLGEATTYFTDYLSEGDWLDELYTTELRSSALITASAQISLSVIQRYKLPLTTIDNNLKNATSELALAYLVSRSLIRNLDDSNNIQTASAGSASVTYFSPTRTRQGKFPQIVRAYLLEINALPSRSSRGAIAEGTEQQSRFERNRFDFDY